MNEARRSAPGAALRFYIIVSLSGAIIMALEILSARILSPSFGSSVYVWGSIISVFLAALSGGYLLGGALADRSPRLSVLGRALLLAAGCQFVILWAGIHLAGRVETLTGGSRYGALLATLVLFAPATVLLAMVSPFAVRIAGHGREELGGVAGRLYAISSLGSLVGTLGCTFVLIPYFTLQSGLSLLIAATLLVALAALLDEPARNLPGMVGAVVLLMLLFVQWDGWRGGDEGLLVRRISPYQTLEVREENGVRRLRSNGVSQSAVHIKTGDPAHGYPKAAIASLLVGPVPEKALVIGLGAGTFGRYLQKHIDGLSVDFVEIDPATVALAKEYFGFSPDGTKQRVFVQDGRRFLAETEERYDLVFCDAYVGLSVPFHLTTLEFFRLLETRLDRNGVLMINLAARVEAEFSKSLLATISSVFHHVYVFGVDGSNNHILLATRRELTRPSAEEFQERALRLEAQYPFEPSFTDVLKRRREIDFDLVGQDVLRDQYAPVDHLIHLDR